MGAEKFWFQEHSSFPTAKTQIINECIFAGGKEEFSRNQNFSAHFFAISQFLVVKDLIFCEAQRIRFLSFFDSLFLVFSSSNLLLYNTPFQFVAPSLFKFRYG